MKSKINFGFGIVAVMIFMAALSRLLPHPPNFTPVAATALFGAAYFGKKYWAFIIPLVALIMSDLLLNNLVYANMYPEFYNGFVWFGPNSIFVYSSVVLIALLGFALLKKASPLRLLAGSLIGSVIFFLITNFGSWMVMGVYPATFSGLMAAYGAGIPYFFNTILGDLFYVAVLFGSFELIRYRFPKLAASHA